MMSLNPSRIVIVVALLVTVLMTCASAQSSAQEQAAKLRAQMADVQGKEAQQRTRLQELDEALKPENIEHSLAGVGSTHPEDLREQRRVQLEKERAGVRTQLDQLAASRMRLEAAIAAADARAYQDSARGPVNMASAATLAPGESSTAAAISQPHKSIKKNRRRHVRRSTQPVPAAPVNP
jgi:chromosome segregation ATPase